MLNGQPLCVDGFCGLGGWAEGFLAEGWSVIGFDIERHRYPRREFALEEDSRKSMHGKDKHGNTLMNRALEQVHGFHTARLTGELDEYPGKLVLQDILTLHGSQLRHADCLVFSPPCQEFSYMAMPWKRGKAIAAALRGNGAFPEGYTGSRTIPQLTALFDACFRIQREACEAAGRHIPMVVENVRGAQPWVGRAPWNYGSFYLWGDVPALMPSTFRAQKQNPDGTQHGQGSWFAVADSKERGARKVPDFNFHEHEKTGAPGRSFQSAAVKGLGGSWFGDYGEMKQKQPVWFNDDKRRAEKCGGDWFGSGVDCSLMRQMSSKSSARKAASAQIAKIPLELSRHIARVYWPCSQRPNLPSPAPIRESGSPCPKNILQA